MGTFKRLALLLFITSPCFCELTSPPSHIGYLIHHGAIKEAIEQYDEWYQESYIHDFDTLERLGISLLEQGWKSKDPEDKILSLFGAGISAHDKVLHILEEGLDSPIPQIQLVSLNFLAKHQSNQADKALLKALSSPYPPIRLEASYYLAQKKDKKAVGIAETLMGKFPEAKPLFPKIFASSGTPDAMRVLKKLLRDPSDAVRIEAILSTAEFQRDDLTPIIRTMLKQHNSLQQEASAIALSRLKDEESIPELTRLSTSKSTSVRLAANYALVKLGERNHLKEIVKIADNGNLYAINALGFIEGAEEHLEKLIHHPNIQVRINAALSLLELRDARALPPLRELFIRDARGLAFAKLSSPSGAMSAYKVIASAEQHAKNGPLSMELSVSIREAALTKTLECPQHAFLEVIEEIFQSRQTDLIPLAIQLLGNIQTDETIALLKRYQNMVGAPLTRNYAALALYKMHISGSHADHLFQWITENRTTKLIEFRAMLPLEARLNKTPYELTPEQNSKLLIDTLESFAKSQDEQGIFALLNAINGGHPKNKYALAGLLIRTNQ